MRMQGTFLISNQCGNQFLDKTNKIIKHVSKRKQNPRWLILLLLIFLKHHKHLLTKIVQSLGMFISVSTIWLMADTTMTNILNVKGKILIVNNLGLGPKVVTDQKNIGRECLYLKSQQQYTRNIFKKKRREKPFLMKKP